MAPRIGAALRERFADALASGALEPIETRLLEFEDGGVRFAVRLARDGERRRAAGPRADPFLPPYDPALHVADLGAGHACLLNRFPVLRHHALVVTRLPAEQQAPLERSDLGAVWSLLHELGGLAFYNAGPAAGASQGHRHFQWVPTPLAPGEHATPVDALLETARFGDGPGRVPGLPFLHGIAKLRSVSLGAGADAASVLHGLYRELSRAFACDRPGRPWNLLLCRDWLLFVPRSRERWEGISLNALAFAGALLVRGSDRLARLREAGPMTALCHGGVSLTDSAPTRSA